MIAQNFEYEAPTTLKEALALIASGEAKILAGGMSLIPMMKLRLASPERLVDLRSVPGLSGIAEEKGLIRIGAMTTHHEVEDSALLRAKCPLLAETASHIGDVRFWACRSSGSRSSTRYLRILHSSGVESSETVRGPTPRRATDSACRSRRTTSRRATWPGGAGRSKTTKRVGGCV